jgi:hypothetical protein
MMRDAGVPPRRENLSLQSIRLPGRREVGDIEAHTSHQYASG